jgi:Fe2+ or Zn2+ uptake regulation protein
VCTICGAVRDVDLDLGALGNPVADFFTASAHVVLRGQCRQCTTPDLPQQTNPQQGAQQ